MADSMRFKIDSDSGRMESIRIDPLSEVEGIVRHHYREELTRGHIYLIEPAEWVNKKTVSIRIHIDGNPGRYIWRGGERIKLLNDRILNGVGLQAKIQFVRHSSPPGENQEHDHNLLAISCFLHFRKEMFRHVWGSLRYGLALAN